MQNDTLQSTEAVFGSIQSLLAGAQENAVAMGGDRARLRIGAGYLRLAAQQASALADLVGAIADVDHPRAARMETLFVQLGRDARDYTSLVTDDDDEVTSAAFAVEAIVRREKAGSWLP